MYVRFYMCSLTISVFLYILWILSSRRIKIPYPLQWGAPTFDAGHAFGMMAAVFVSLIEVMFYQKHKNQSKNSYWTLSEKSLILEQSTGAYKAASRLASATPPPAHVLSRGIGWQVNIWTSSIFLLLLFFPFGSK